MKKILIFLTLLVFFHSSFFINCGSSQSLQLTETYNPSKSIALIKDKFIYQALKEIEKLGFVVGYLNKYSTMHQFAFCFRCGKLKKKLELNKILASLFQYISDNYKAIDVKDIEHTYEFFLHCMIPHSLSTEKLFKLWKIKIRFNDFIENEGVLTNVPNCFNEINLENVGDRFISQTEAHLFSNLNWMRALFLKHKAIFNDPKIKRFLIQIHEKEKDEIQRGRYVFYHARDQQWKFDSEVFKELWHIRYNERVPENFIFFRYLLKETLNTATVKNNRKDCLFMNHALFGNCHEFTMACSFTQYWLKNYSINKADNKLHIQNLFKLFDFTKYYDTYKTDLDRLEKLHSELSQYGEMIMLSLPEELTNHTTIATLKPGGAFSAIEIDGNIMVDPKEIIDQLKANNKKIRKASYIKLVDQGDSNWFEWGLYLDSKTLDPNSGIKMYSFYMADEKKLAEYNQLKQEIFEKIKRAIQQDEDQIRSKL